LADNNAKISVARRLGVKPDWDTIKYQTYCVILANGKTRSDAEQALRAVDGFLVRASALRVDYIFYNGNVGRHLSTIYVRLDDDGRITDRWLVEVTGISDTNRVDIDCSKLRKTSGEEVK
jgi:hypothetical protein